MSEPKRGKHKEFCRMVCPDCMCNTCQKDGDCCLFMERPLSKCQIDNCPDYLADEPTKKGAADV